MVVVLGGHLPGVAATRGVGQLKLPCLGRQPTCRVSFFSRPLLRTTPERLSKVWRAAGGVLALGRAASGGLDGLHPTTRSQCGAGRILGREIHTDTPNLAPSHLYHQWPRHAPTPSSGWGPGLSPPAPLARFWCQRRSVVLRVAWPGFQSLPWATATFLVFSWLRPRLETSASLRHPAGNRAACVVAKKALMTLVRSKPGESTQLCEGMLLGPALWLCNCLRAGPHRGFAYSFSRL